MDDAKPGISGRQDFIQQSSFNHEQSKIPTSRKSGETLGARMFLNMKLTLSKIAEFISAAGQFPRDELAQGYSIDSRTIEKGELFFAVTGERLDGHDYVGAALEKGAVAAVVRSDQLDRYPDKSRLLAVQNTLVGLQTLATAARKLWGKPLVGVTGSTGKTTTKEAIANVLGTRWRVLKSEGNFNNHFGLPLMLLKLEPEHDVAVIEMGMSHAGEIRALARIAQPEMGVVTNVAPVHLEFFDSLASIARVKYELIESLPSGGTAVLNADDEYVAQFGRGFKGKVVRYGTQAAADVRAEKIQSHGVAGLTFDVVTAGGHESAHLPLLGKHNVLNALAAVAVGLARGLTLAEASGALAALAPADKRGQVLKLGNITVINDCYNSNPKALRAMVEALAAMEAGRRIVVAGEMLELGPAGEGLHREAGRHIAERKIDVLVGVRGLAQAMVESARQAGMRAEFVATPEEAGEWLARETRDGDVVLLKASRGVKLEKALEGWEARRDGPS
jgi:UDP-N-acetylmuramoyl-tripeptide--D-alanyl-D-alanine ligase